MHTIQSSNAKPGEARISGSQPLATPNASHSPKGLAVAPGAEKSAPAADEKDAEIQDLRADLELARGRILGYQEVVESLEAVVTTKNTCIDEQAREIASLRAMLGQSNKAMRITHMQNLARRPA